MVVTGGVSVAVKPPQLDDTTCHRFIHVEDLFGCIEMQIQASETKFYQLNDL